MSNWTASDWVIFFGALGGFFTVAVIPAIIAWRKSEKQQGQINTNAQAVSELIDINKDNPMTRDVKSTTEASVKQTLIENPPKPDDIAKGE